MTTTQFKRDLARGHAGEAFLLSQHADLEPAPEGERRWDLQALKGGYEPDRIEVKTDSYDPARTPNFFMEMLTTVNGVRDIVGGPWRARADKVDTFVYLYYKPGRATAVGFWFYDLPALVKELDRNSSHFQMRSVKLDRLHATGLLVPRAAVAHLYTQVVYP